MQPRTESAPARPVQIVDTLATNASNVTRFVVNGLCEAEGVAAIEQLVRRSTTEEMWVFIPGSGDAVCQWHELGDNESSGTDAAYVRVDRAYLGELMRSHAELHLYHYHPLAYFDCLADAGCREGAADVARAAGPDPRLISDIRFAMPSPSDIHFMMEATSRFHELRPRDATVEHWVITPYGRVRYGLTEAGRARFDADKDSRSQGLYITWVAADALTDESIATFIAAHPGDVAAALGRLTRSLNTANLHVIHEPREPGVKWGPR
ncbi:MAG: hypothetical protein R3286_12015 [Gammaproteobacteria bacterium]|nr:hypothetical protein [Gammaproteobacteria bacterium]